MQVALFEFNREQNDKETDVTGSITELRLCKQQRRTTEEEDARVRWKYLLPLSNRKKKSVQLVPHK
jgi:hypothetical protein